MSKHSPAFPGLLLPRLADFNRIGSVDTAVQRAFDLANTEVDSSVTTLWADDRDAGTMRRVEASSDSQPPPPDRVLSVIRESGTSRDTAGVEVHTAVDRREQFGSELFVTAGDRYVLSLGSRERDAFDEQDERVVEGIAATLEAALDRLDGHRSSSTAETATQAGTSGESHRGGRDGEVEALYRLHEVTAASDDFDEAVGRLLELGCDYLGLETGTLGRVDSGEREIECVVDETGTHEAGATTPLEESISEATLTGRATDTLAFADVADTEYGDHPATEAVGACVAAPVVVDGDAYGTVNFSSPTPRAAEIRRSEREFVGVIAQWLSSEVDRRRQLSELERHETILEAVGDPVYALDADGRFTFVNEAAKREFGYGEEVLGDHVAVGMDAGDIDRMQEQIEALLGSDERSTTAEFEVETADGDRRIVENRLAVIGGEEFRGSAGVLRDVTDRSDRRRKLEEFRQAVEEAADGVAILDGDEYEYIDRTHVDMYGFDSTEQLLGDTWRRLYDDEEVARLEREAFPALEADGHWRGQVTGSRPDGSTFPAELSLTIVNDGRLVCTVRDISARKRRRQQLEEFQQAIESAEDGVAVLDGDEYEYIDRTHVDMYGFDDKEQLLGDTWRRLYDDEEVARLEREAFPALEADGHWRGMVTGTRPDGSTLPAELSLTIVDDGRLVCTVRDETERQARKRELEGRSAAIEAAEDGIAILNEDAEYTYVNRAHAEMYGYDDSAAFFGNSWEMCYEDPERDRLTTEALPELAEDGGWRGEAVGLREDGTTFPQDVSLAQLGDGRIVCVVRDVTERKAREEELELKERAMDEANVGIQITDPTQEDNPLVYVNEGFERTTGYAREDALGRNPRFLQDEDTDPEKVAQLREAIETEEPVSMELQNYRHDGTTYWSRLSITPVEDEDGTVTNYIGIQQDVSQRREREIQREARVELLKRIYEVTTDQTLTFEEKITELLEAGRDYLNLPYGFLTRIETGDEGESGTQTILEALGSHDLLQPDESVPLEQSYCRKTVQRDGLMTVTHAAEEGWADDLAHETFELETYIGGEVVAGDEVYGTVCFASKEPRDHPFTEFEQSFIRLLGRWAGYEIDRRNTRDELREQRERLELALSGTNTGLAEWNLETDAVTWDETLVDIVGREADSLGEFRAAVHPDDRDRVQRELETMIETGDPWVGEFRMLDDDGDTLWLGTRATAVYSSGGEPVRVLATGTDISEKKKAEREQRRNERRYRSLAQNIPDGAVVTFDGDLNYCLAAGELLPELGFEPSDISETEVGSLIPDADIRDELLPRFRAVFDGERTDRRIELGGRTLRIQLVAVDDSHGQSPEGRGLMLAQDVTEEARREQELYEERERFRLLIESVDEYAFFVVDEEGVVQNWNEGAEHTFGYDAEAAIGLSIAELHPEADRELGLPDRLLQQARMAGESAHEGWRVRVDGSQFYADVRYAPLEADDGTFRGYATITRDMTNRRLQRRRTELFVKESDDVVTVLDTDGTITYASGSADRVLGYDPDDLVGENLFDHLHPDSRGHAMEVFYDCVDGLEQTQAECRLESPGGEWLTVEGRCRNMLDDEAVGGILLYLRDVTESKERARRFESIFNQTFQFTALLDTDGTLLEINESTLEFAGVERDAVVGEQFDEIRWWTHSESVRDRVRDALDRAASGESVRYETEVRGADGIGTIDLSMKPVTDDDGDVSMLVAEGRDITDQQRRRQHLNVLQRVMRHNIRNDLTKLRGWTRMLSAEDDPSERAATFESVERTLDKWEKMTEQMRQIRQLLRSRQEHGSLTEVPSLVEDAVTATTDRHPDATVRTDLRAAVDVSVPTVLFEAVAELLDNAVRVSDDTPVEVACLRPADGWIEVAVSDRGPGMPDAEADVLESGEETPLSHGTGLGLWMVRMVATEVGGEVSVTVDSGGTTVHLEVPLDENGGRAVADPVR